MSNSPPDEAGFWASSALNLPFSSNKAEKASSEAPPVPLLARSARNREFSAMSAR